MFYFGRLCLLLLLIGMRIKSFLLSIHLLSPFIDIFQINNFPVFVLSRESNQSKEQGYQEIVGLKVCEQQQRVSFSSHSQHTQQSTTLPSDHITTRAIESDYNKSPFRWVAGQIDYSFSLYSYSLFCFVIGSYPTSSPSAAIDLTRLQVELYPRRSRHIGLMAGNLLTNGDAESGTSGTSPPGWNICTYAQSSCTSSSCTTAQATCTNGDLCSTAGGTGWQTSTVTSDVNSGSKAFVNKCGSGYFNYMQQVITTYTVGTYTLSFWAKINSGGSTWEMNAGPNTAQFQLAANSNPPTTYTLYTYNFTATSTQTTVFFAGMGDSGSQQNR